MSLEQGKKLHGHLLPSCKVSDGKPLGEDDRVPRHAQDACVDLMERPLGKTDSDPIVALHRRFTVYRLRKKVGELRDYMKKEFNDKRICFDRIVIGQKFLLVANSDCVHHYTSRDGLRGILHEGGMRHDEGWYRSLTASFCESRARDCAAFGSGVYFLGLPPERVHCPGEVVSAAFNAEPDNPKFLDKVQFAIGVRRSNIEAVGGWRTEAVLGSSTWDRKDGGSTEIVRAVREPEQPGQDGNLKVAIDLKDIWCWDAGQEIYKELTLEELLST